MSVSTNRGVLICIEGIDGSGKTTLCQNLFSYFKNLNRLSEKCCKISFPEIHNQTGKLIEEILRKTEYVDNEILTFLFALNRYEMKDTIEKLLENGITLFVDRYTLSGLAYARAILDSSFYEWITEINAFDIIPDLTLYLDVSLETAVNRKTEKEKLYDGDIEKLEQIQNNYRWLIETEKNLGKIIELDGEQNEEMLLHNAVFEIEKILMENARQPVQQLRRKDTNEKLEIIFEAFKKIFENDHPPLPPSL